MRMSAPLGEDAVEAGLHLIDVGGRLVDGLQGRGAEELFERELRDFEIVPMLGEVLAAQVARNYRALRAAGFTVRKTPDLIIGTYCIEHGHTLLHADRDFEPMREHLGLQVV